MTWPAETARPSASSGWEERKLKTGDIIRIGKTTITFRAEPFVPTRHRPDRPAVPSAPAGVDETLAGTIFDLEFEPAAEPMHRPVKPPRPVPRPRPRDPDSFATDDVYSMLEQIASSSWDSIYAINAQPLRKSRLMPQPIIAGQPRARPTRPMVSIALQASVAVKSNIEKSESRIVNASKVSISSVSPVSKPRRRFARFGRWITRVGTLRLF